MGSESKHITLKYIVKFAENMAYWLGENSLNIPIMLYNDEFVAKKIELGDFIETNGKFSEVSEETVVPSITTIPSVKIK